MHPCPARNPNLSPGADDLRQHHPLAFQWLGPAKECGRRRRRAWQCLSPRRGCPRHDALAAAAHRKTLREKERRTSSKPPPDRAAGATKRFVRGAWCAREESENPPRGHRQAGWSRGLCQEASCRCGSLPLERRTSSLSRKILSAHASINLVDSAQDFRSRGLTSTSRCEPSLTPSRPSVAGVSHRRGKAVRPSLKREAYVRKSAQLIWPPCATARRLRAGFVACTSAVSKYANPTRNQGRRRTTGQRDRKPIC